MPTYLIEMWTNTLCMYNMDVGSNQRWSTPSTMTSWHHFYSTVTQNLQNLTQLQLCSNSVRVHSYAYLPYWKVLKHFLDVHYGCGNQSQVVYSLNRDIMASFPLDSHPELPTSHYICSMWIWEAIKGGNQPQQWHHGIIFIWQSPRIAKIWPSFSSVMV